MHAQTPVKMMTRGGGARWVGQARRRKGQDEVQHSYRVSSSAHQAASGLTKLSSKASLM